MSPELLYPQRFGLKDSRPTKESDCYALGMVVYEVLSGHVPFAKYQDLVVLGKVIEGERPIRPSGVEGASFTDDLWGILGLCWSALPKDRLAVKVVLEYLEDTIRAQQPPAPGIEDYIASDDELASPVNYYSGFRHPVSSLMPIFKCSLQRLERLYQVTTDPQGHHEIPRLVLRVQRWLTMAKVG
jgi:hypothetical protein